MINKTGFVSFAEDCFQCDFTRPGCLRCAKINNVCPGYRDEQDLLFHNQSTLSFETNARKPPRRGTTSSSNVSNGSPSSAKLQGQNCLSSNFPVRFQALTDRSQGPATYLVIAPRMIEDWNTYSIPVVLKQFSPPPDRPHLFGYLDCLPDLYQELQNGPDSCLGLATSSVAKAYITNITKSSSSRIEHVQIHTRALRAVHSALSDPCERLKDSTIVAVQLLRAHEVSEDVTLTSSNLL